MQGIVHITPAIWVRDGDRSPVRLGDADELADWLGRTCAALMQSPTVNDHQILELEGLLARVEAAIDAGHLPAGLRRDVVAAIATLNGVSVTAALPDDDRPVPAPDSPTDRPRLRILTPPALSCGGSS